MIFPYKTTKMTSGLLENLEKLHTTELGVVRIKRNLGLKTDKVLGAYHKPQPKTIGSDSITLWT